MILHILIHFLNTVDDFLKNRHFSFLLTIGLYCPNFLFFMLLYIIGYFILILIKCVHRLSSSQRLPRSMRFWERVIMGNFYYFKNNRGFTKLDCQKVVEPWPHQLHHLLRPRVNSCMMLTGGSFILCFKCGVDGTPSYNGTK